MPLTRGRLACALFVVVSSVYYATLSGITCSNDGSHFALVRAIAELGQTEITPYAALTEGYDYAEVDGRKYSDRPPGTALLTVPLYLLGNILPSTSGSLPSRHDAENPALAYALLTPVLLGTATVVLCFLLLCRWRVPDTAALAAAGCLAFGTIHWKYSTVLFSHAASGFLILSCIALLSELETAPRLGLRASAGLGFALGLSIAVEYSNLLLVLLVVGFLCFRRENLQKPLRLLPPLAACALGAALPVGALLWYDAVNFGHPLRVSYAASAGYPWARTFLGTFTNPLILGLQALLFIPPETTVLDADGMTVGGANQGIFWLSPVLMFAVAGYFPGCRRVARTLSFAALVLALYVVVFASHRTFHGFTRDSRYFAPYLPLLALGLGFHFEKLFQQSLLGTRALLAHLVVFGLFFLSLRNIATHIALSFNYMFQWGKLQPVALYPGDVVYFLRSLLPNLAGLPRLWLLEAVAFLPFVVRGFLRR